MIVGATSSSRRAGRAARGPAVRGAVAGWSRAVVFAGVLGAAGQVDAQSAASPAFSAASAAAANAQELRGWLVRIHDAAVRVNFVGTLVNNGGGSVVSERVAHFWDGRSELERIEAQDGEARSLLRINDQVRTIWPRFRVAVLEPADPRASFPSLVTGSEQRIPDFYELRVEPPDRVAGRDADRLMLKARDAARFDHAIWLDRLTGLLLRVDVLVDGHMLESSAFSDVKIGVRPDAAAIYAELHRADGFRVMKPTLQPTRLEAEGWTMRPELVPAGFQLLGCVRRALQGADGTDPAQATVLQTIFSDGLTHVSLFIEPFQPQRHKSAGPTAIGATHTLARRMNDSWVTVVGDVPAPTLEQFARALDRVPAGAVPGSAPASGTELASQPQNRMNFLEPRVPASRILHTDHR